MIYLQGKPQAVPYLGIEHLQPSQNCFHWQKPEVPIEERQRAAEQREHDRIRSLSNYYARTKSITVQAAKEMILRKNKYSTVGRSTQGQADRSAQIRKAGI